MTHLQQTTLVNIVRIREIAHNKQFLLFPICFQLYSISILSMIEEFHNLDMMFSLPLQICYIWEGLTLSDMHQIISSNAILWKISLNDNIIIDKRYSFSFCHNVFKRVVKCVCKRERVNKRYIAGPRPVYCTFSVPC